MIRNLKIKFVAITMLMVSIIIITLFSVIFVSNIRSMRSQSIEDLSKIISMSLLDFDVSEQYGESSNMRKMQFTPLFIVYLDKKGEILSQIKSNVSIDDESLLRAKEIARKSKSSVGTIPDIELRFLKREMPLYEKIAFIDISRENDAIESLILILTLTGIVAEILFLGISVFLSSWALKPVEKAWNQQKQFIADASHELKTPLTILLANIDILEENRCERIENQMKWIHSSKQEALQMKQLLEEMLFLAKSDANKIQVSQEKLNVSDLLVSQILSLEVIAFEKRLTINYDGVEDDLYIKANEKQIVNLFSILLENACKYSDSGATVTVVLKKEQDKIHLSIHNFGEIIPKEELENIFERFYRVEKSRNKSKGGYGLGLSIAKRIVDSNNMKIVAESNKEKGTTFFVHMPSIG